MLSGRNPANVLQIPNKPTKKKVSFNNNISVASFNVNGSSNNILREDDRRLTNSNIHFGTLNRRLGQQRQDYQSETRSAFGIPKIKSSRKIAEYNAKNASADGSSQHPIKYQEHPPFSLRKIIPNKNKIIDAAKVPAILAKNRQKQQHSLFKEWESDEKEVFVLKGITSLATPHNTGPEINTFSFMEDPQKEFHESGVEDGRFRFVVDMSGFHSSQIKLKLKGRKLMVEAKRPMTAPWLGERKIAETIHLPANVFADNLKIDRDSFGYLYVREAWKF